MNFKKILIATDGYLNDGTGSGVTLSNLFKGWDTKKISVFSVAYDKKFGGLLYSDDCFNGEIVKTNTSQIKNKSIKTSLKNILNKPEIRHYLTPFAPIKVTKKSITELKKYNTDIIYAPVSDIYSIRRLVKIKSYCKKAKVYTVFFDDLIDRYDNLTLSFLYKKIHFLFLKKIIAISDKTFVCSEAMKEEYQIIFKSNFYVVSNPVDLDLVKNYRVLEKNKLNFNVVYAGTVNSKNINNLKLMSSVVEKLNKEGIDIRFDLYTFGSKLDVVKKSISYGSRHTRVYKAPTDDHELFTILGNASILYLPMDFTEESIKSIRLSYLTKQPLYMSIGVPMIVHGPEEIHVVRHAKEYKYAEVLLSESIEDLYNILKKHFYNYENFLFKTENGIKYAKNKHDILTVQKWFYSHLLD